MQINKQTALKNLLYKMADDALILGHRNSEWTGLGPIIEEDIAFSSMAQDKIGHASALYTILHEELGEPQPDNIAFGRKARDYRCCWLVELPIGEYDFSLMRHFLFDHAEMLRYTALRNSSFTPLAQLANKIKGELKYHILHANVWIQKLGTSTETAHARLQTALNQAFPYALGIFEPSQEEAILMAENIFMGEQALQKQWLESIEKVLMQANLMLPDVSSVQPVYGGRQGYHSEHLAPLLKEMTEVFSLDEEAEW